MDLFLGVMAIILLACVVFVNVQASLYYASVYAKATRRGFVDVVRDPHACAVYRVSRKLATRGDRATERMLFDVALPRVDAPSVPVDAVLVSEQGIGVFCVQEGRGSVFGDATDDFWVLVGSHKRDGSERLVPNVSEQVCAGADALRDYLLLDEAARVRVAPCAVFADRVDFGNVELEGICATHLRNVRARFKETLAETASTTPLFDDKARRMMHRVLKACANASVAAHAEGGAWAEGAGPTERVEPIAWVRSIVHRERADLTAADLVRKADRLVSSKEDFDALTWDRILEISKEIDAAADPERTAELAAELRLIAHTNISLNYRFGIAQAPEDAHLSPAGLTVESSVAEMSVTGPDEQMHEALQDTDFFGEHKQPEGTGSSGQTD